MDKRLITQFQLPTEVNNRESLVDFLLTEEGFNNLVRDVEGLPKAYINPNHPSLTNLGYFYQSILLRDLLTNSTVSGNEVIAEDHERSVGTMLYNEPDLINRLTTLLAEKIHNNDFKSVAIIQYTIENLGFDIGLSLRTHPENIRGIINFLYELPNLLDDNNYPKELFILSSLKTIMNIHKGLSRYTPNANETEIINIERIKLFLKSIVSHDCQLELLTEFASTYRRSTFEFLLTFEDTRFWQITPKEHDTINKMFGY